MIQQVLSFVVRSFSRKASHCSVFAFFAVGGTLCLAPFSVATARADAPSALPVVPLHSNYPTGVKVKDHTQVSNVEMDCNWNADCSSGVTVFHQVTQESLGRVSGWMQRGKYQSGKKMIVFVTWGSTYSAESSTNDDGTAAGSQAAAEDFGAQVVADGATTTTCPSFTLPATQVACWTLRGDGTPGNPKTDRYWIMAWWSGTAEVEMAAYANTKYAMVRTTFHTLAAQTMGASAVPPAAAAPGVASPSASDVHSRLTTVKTLATAIRGV